MKKLLTLILAGAMCLSMAACGGNETEEAGSDLAYITEKGKMIVGITDYAPMDYRDENGEWTGFDAEFARAVCEQLVVEP